MTIFIVHKREFEAGDLDSKKVLMLEGFKNKKSNALADINTRGANLKSEKNLEIELKGIENRIILEILFYWIFE
jgi:hypothetical protein